MRDEGNGSGIRGDTRVAIAQFSQRWQRERSFIEGSNALNNELNKIEQLGGGTNIDEALWRTWTTFIKRYARPAVSVVIVLLTDW